MSVVILVMSDDSENLSIFSKENVPNFLYKSSLKFDAIPTEAIEAYLPPKIPNVKEQTAIPNRMRAI